MRAKSHRNLGILLADRYFPGIPPLYRSAFLLGCTQPDQNPATYLKGSLRCQWLRGHNYENARRFLSRITLRLENKDRLGLWDYYTAGKLIHYTADAFTYAHNTVFQGGIPLHRAYEARLQICFLRFLEEEPPLPASADGTLAELIRAQHRRYLELCGKPETDCRFVFCVCCQIARHLSEKNIPVRPQCM